MNELDKQVDFQKVALNREKLMSIKKTLNTAIDVTKSELILKIFTIYAVHHSLHVSVHTSSSRNFTVQTPLQREARTGELANE